MKRTKISDRQLPGYGKDEEIVNMLTHIVGIVLGAVALLMCVVKTMQSGDNWGLGASVVFGVTMVLLYTISSVYHGWQDVYEKKVLEVVDHCTIYLLIAGTFMPIIMTRFREKYFDIAWTIFALVWAISIVGIVFTAIDHNKYKILSMSGYLAPWLLLFIIPQIKDVFGVPFIWYLVGGGISYTIGAVLYGLFSGKVKFMHSVFHIFILIGSLIHFMGIFTFCI